MAMKTHDIKKKLHAKSERVKGVDIHPREPWVICSLYTGQVTLWNYDNNTMIKSFNIVEQPVRCVKFIPRMNWFICGSDDLFCRVFNYNTMEKVKEFETHQDYIRAVAVHESLPLVLTSSDDMTVKLWDWDKGWANTMMFEGHVHYVMAVVWNPKDPNTFASASLDRTVKVWNRSAYLCNFTLEGHQQGVNCVEYYPGGDKPYLISGSDDRTVKIWDYQTKACVQTLSQHTHNVSSVLFFPDKPLIITGSEDETIKVWQLQTYRLEASLDYGMHRVWTLGAAAGSNKLAIGCDKGTVVLRIGKEEPVFSMDGNGKIVFSSNHDIVQINLKGNVPSDTADGEKIALGSKEMGTCENLPKRIEHNASGQYVAVVFDDEYVVNSSLAWRAQSMGPCVDFAWAADGKTYAILESGNKVKIYKSFKEKATISDVYGQKLFGGPLLAVRGEGQIAFYDWDTGFLIQKIDMECAPKSVTWNESGEMVSLVADTSFYVLQFNKTMVTEVLESEEDIPEDGVEDAFVVEAEIEERVRQGVWIGDCFVFVCRNQRLNSYIGGEVRKLAALERPMWLLGYLPKDNRLYLTDKARNVVSYQLFQAVIDFQTAVVRGDLTLATRQYLPKIPDSQRDSVAAFLEAQEYKELALEVATEDEQVFRLAIGLHRLEIAQRVAAKDEDPSAKLKWKQVGDLALQHAEFDLAAEAFKKGDDYNSLLLLYSSLEDSEGLKQVAKMARDTSRHNTAFTASYLVGDLRGCVELLCEADRPAEAALFARSYVPEMVPDVVLKWRKFLGATKFSEAIADPSEFPNLFPEIGHLFEKKEEVEEKVAEEEEAGAPSHDATTAEEPASDPVAAAAPEPPASEPPVPEPPAPEPAPEPPAEPPAPEPPAPEPPAQVAEPTAEPAAAAALGSDDLSDFDIDKDDGFVPSPVKAPAVDTEDLEKMFDD